MARRDNQVKTYLSDQEKRRLTEWADEVNKSQSHLIREAVLEYLDHDRTARVEERLDDIEAELSALTQSLGDQTTHTHKPQTGMSKATEATEKARSIVRRVRENHGDVVACQDVEIAIEDIAGVDERTKRKYKRLFRRRGYLFEHPGETAVWTADSDQWLSWLEDYGRLNGADAVRDVADEYPVNVHATANGVQIETTDDLKTEL